MKYILSGLIIISFLITSCVKQDAQVVLKSIQFTPDTLTFAVGTTKKLSPVFTPAAFSTIAVEWDSTDESVATLSPDGYLSVKKSGKIWVTVKDKNSATAGRAYIIIP